ncbi:MAG: hypothetical protein ABH950_03195 [Candidatus Altiarchaeota archaeon]
MARYETGLTRKRTHLTSEELRLRREEETHKPLIEDSSGTPSAREDTRTDEFNAAIHAYLENLEKPMLRFDEFIGQQEVKEGLRKIARHDGTSVVLAGSAKAGRETLIDCFASEKDASVLKLEFREATEFIERYGQKGIVELLKEAQSGGPAVLMLRDVRAESEGPTHEWVEKTLDLFKSAELAKVTCIAVVDDEERDAKPIMSIARHKFKVTLPVKESRRQIISSLLTTANEESLSSDSSKALVSEDVNLDMWARKTAEFSYCDILNFIDDARDIAREETSRADEAVPRITNTHLSKAILGAYEAKGKKIPQHPYEKTGTILHEIGHALLAKVLEGVDPPDLITFQAVDALGYTFYLGESAAQESERDLIDNVAVFLGGIYAEDLVMGENRSGGGSGDFEQIKDILSRAVIKSGFGGVRSRRKVDDVLPPTIISGTELGDPNGEDAYEEHTLKVIESRMDRLRRKAAKIAKDTLKKYEYELLEIAELCIVDDLDSLTGEEFRSLFERFSEGKKSLKKSKKYPARKAEVTRRFTTRMYRQLTDYEATRKGEKEA